MSSPASAAKASEVRENDEMIVKLYHQYKYDHVVAIRAASKIQRDLSRAEHEANRLERHMSRIEAFCKQHNIVLEEL